jgi:hypothetical protein
MGGSSIVAGPIVMRGGMGGSSIVAGPIVTIGVELVEDVGGSFVGVVEGFAVVAAADCLVLGSAAKRPKKTVPPIRTRIGRMIASLVANHHVPAQAQANA